MENVKELNIICQKPDYKTKGNWMARNITRDMAVPLTWLFLHTSITANQITLLSLIVGLSASVAFVFFSKASILIGALLLQIWYLLDHVDGQVARYRKQQSLTGIYFDFVSHYVIHCAIFLGIGFGLYNNTGRALYLILGIFAGLGVIFLNLIYDVLYKVYFKRIEGIERIYLAKKCELIDSTSGLKSKMNLLKMGFSLLHKICEVHVLMNIITILSILGFWLDMPWGLFILMYAILGPILAFLKNTYFILSRVPDNLFTRYFEIINEN
jgi:phosphatidylglycerophosphate synthase